MTSWSGKITFSPAANSDGTTPWYALGPVSVMPEHQGLGIGAMLIEQGLAELREQGALGCILTGNPDYYRRFGFTLAPANVPVRESAEYFMLKAFTSTSPYRGVRIRRVFLCLKLGTPCLRFINLTRTQPCIKPTCSAPCSP